MRLKSQAKEGPRTIGFLRHGGLMKRQKHTILLVEDDSNDRKLIEMAFRANGLTDPIRMVENGAEAIAYLKGEGDYGNRSTFGFPSFIITDLKLPVLDGFCVLEALKRNPAWA